MTASSRFALVAILLIFSIACGGGESTPPEGGAASATTDTTSESGSADSAEVDITAEDLAGYERGITREIEAIHEAQKMGAGATDAQERSRAMQAQWETATIPQGAEASGLDEERYRAVRQVVHDLLRTLDFKGEIDGPMSIDLERVDEATKTRLARDAYADFPAETATALRAAVPRLAPIWIEYVKLTAVAG